MTRTTPLRRMILQLRQIFLTEAETLIFSPHFRCACAHKNTMLKQKPETQVLPLKLAFLSKDSYC